MTDERLDPDFERIIRRVAPFLGDGNLRPDTDLLAVGLDSMRVVQLLAEIEDTYEVSIPDEELLGDALVTPGGLWKLVCAQRGPA